MTLEDPKAMQALATALSQAGAPSSVNLPEDAPFDPAQRQWLSGLLTGLQAIAASVAGEAVAEQPGTALTILYGSQSGNCEGLSKDLRKFAKTRGFEAEIKALNELSLADLSSVNHLLIVTATFGEGDPPDNAAQFHAALMAEDAPSLPDTLNFAVCGLGDSSYTHFNKTARDIDERLAELGASRATDLVACDTDYDDDYAAWKETAFGSEAFENAAGAVRAPSHDPGERKPDFDKTRPFMASLIDARRLSGAASAKRVNHIELSLAGGGPDLEYQAGDALGVWPVNATDDVDSILEITGLTGIEPVQLKSGAAPLRAALQTQLDIVTVTPKTIEAWDLEDMDVSGLHVVDVLFRARPNIGAQELVHGLRPLQPRLYSISSSPKAHPGEVHLTVGEVHYELEGEARKGVASTFLGGRLAAGNMVGVYVHRSSHFHLPEDDNVPLIMIGPGTGIAPFRAFLEERQARAATGPNWLFFGDQHEASDYLYREEIEAWRASGLLTRASLAWSRDSAEKVYVQTLLQQAGADVFRWLEEGAAIYICGDASRMASDVDATLREIIVQHGNQSEEGAEAYLSALASGHRYQRDVY